MHTRAWGAALGIVAVTLAGCAELRAAEPPPRTITATATGRVAVRPDTAQVQVGVEARAPSLADATAEVSRRMTAVLERLRALGVAERDVATVTYAIDPLTSPRRAEEESPRILGYRVANVVQARIRQLEAVGRILDAAVAAGANVLRGPTFTVAEPAPVEAQARALAVRNAATKARQLAEAAGVTLGELVLLTEGEPHVVPRFAEARVTAAPGAPGPVEAGQLEITVTVTAHYRIGK
jgi:hypothetical protein